jgi:DNA transformation protein
LAASPEFLEFITEQMAGVGPVSVRKMFGGAGIFRGDRMIALVADDLLYLRSDHVSAPEFEARGLGPFVYEKAGKPVSMSYRRAPAECFEDPDEMVAWATRAYEACLRAGATARRRSNSRRPAR